MKRVILFEDARYRQLLPLIYWRTIGELLCGPCWLAAHVARAAGRAITDLWVRPEIAPVARDRFRFAVNEPLAAGDKPALLINARYLPAPPLPDCAPGRAGVLDGQLAYACLPGGGAGGTSPEALLDASGIEKLLKKLKPTDAPGVLIEYPWDLLHHNERLLHGDFLARTGMDGEIADGAHLINPDKIAVGKESRIMPGAVLDASDGGIEIGQGVTVSPLAVIQGPARIGHRCLIQPGAVIRHGCSIGPVCKLGGEIEATIIQGHSNKQHDGFLGHAYLCSWINLGADTVNSDLKNTYGPVRVPINGREVDSGRTFVGMFAGDHVKSGIGQTFSTGTVVGFGSMVATGSFPPSFIPSFSWLTDQGMAEYDVERCLTVAKRVMARRDVEMSATEEELFRGLPRICADHEQTGTAQ